MKTIITIILSLLVSISFAQQKELKLEVSQEFKEELKEALTVLSKKLEDVERNEFFSKSDIVKLQTKMEEVSQKISYTLEKEDVTLDSLNAKVTKKIKFTINLDEDDQTPLAGFTKKDLSNIERKLSEAASIFEKSPSFLELKSRLEKLEQQNNKNNK
ncbi:GumC domain-containing protein [Dokdonia donghaensis]|uniref:Uncharacterized protein n=1 Tax=Dokdonia donghaensis DSW-1 TaxID=1300343 RepID=A0A0A2GW85_9FLAO|nr:hypothetical protein [Dokdonia donghaensis]ANH59161.1 hypothetical protein I597_0227 [Dokdonia donghaensis DSW-1]KGO06581.1 hypothetical protein NV36_06825 [Dokdonia donghaensis DSW-1]